MLSSPRESPLRISGHGSARPASLNVRGLPKLKLYSTNLLVFDRRNLKNGIPDSAASGLVTNGRIPAGIFSAIVQQPARPQDRNPMMGRKEDRQQKQNPRRDRHGA